MSYIDLIRRDIRRKARKYGVTMIVPVIDIAIGDYVVAWDRSTSDWYGGYVSLVYDETSLDQRVGGFSFKMDHDDDSLKGLFIKLRGYLADGDSFVFIGRDKFWSRHLFVDDELSVLVLAQEDA